MRTMPHEMNPPGRVTISMDADGVAQVRLIRTDKMNALDPDMFAALLDAGRTLYETAGLRAVVLAGEGRSFCAGLDMGSMAQTGRHRETPLTERTHGNANGPQQVAKRWPPRCPPTRPRHSSHCSNRGSFPKRWLGRRWPGHQLTGCPNWR